MMHLWVYLILLFASIGFVIPEECVRNIDVDVFRNMYTYAHLMDISYCVSPTSKLEEPFKCDLGCEKRFPNMTLVYQWYLDDAVAGYISYTHSNIFDYEDTQAPKKTIIVSLRGTRSVFDSYTDIKVDMVEYRNLGLQIPRCDDCKVHRGFYDYYIHTLMKVDGIIQEQLDDEEYELLIVGHSLGGSVALLLGLHFLDLGYDKLTVVTMGQPLVGNEPFVRFVDSVMGSSLPVQHNSYDRKYFRVIHKKDVVPTIPSNRKIVDSYVQFDNQIYLNCSVGQTNPTWDQVVDCVHGDNPSCIRGDFDRVGMFNNYLQAHTTYFRSMGLCGIRM